MENLGYKEGSTKPKVGGKRRMSRARPSIVENEALPLSLAPRFVNDSAWLVACLMKTFFIVC
jgi:hypothetical protein